MADDSVVELDGEKAREEFEERHGVEPPEQGRVFRGHFESSEETTLAVHRPGEALELYSDGRRVSSLDLGDYTDERPPEDVMGFPPGALELVRDGTQELQVVHTESDGDETVYHLNIYKFIGSRIGTIFSEPVAVRGADGSLRRLVRPRYLQGLDHRIIEWTPLDENEEPAGEAERYKWNEWEGVYRIPSRPPTAPRSMVDDAMDG